MRHVSVIGMGISPFDISKQAENIISNAKILVGGTRFLDCYKDHKAEKIPVCANLNEVVEKIKTALLQELDVVVLADGDPGFYGIGNLLVNKLGRESVKLFPNITTLQLAASRLKISWQDIPTVSLHGRKNLQPLLNYLSIKKRVGVFTDRTYSPSKIAEELLSRQADVFQMFVFENLGTKDERISGINLKKASEKVFSDLNFVILERTGYPEISLSLGMGDDSYIHQKGLITKKEIRAAGLAELRIKPDHVVWDLGSGCGSVAIEASCLASNGLVVAVEKDHERVLQIKENIRRMGAYAVDVLCGVMPECLYELPDPDRIFIGGGIGHDDGVLEEAVKRLKPQGRMVLHIVLTGSLIRAIKYFKDIKWPFSVSQISVSRSVPIYNDMRLESQNPVFIISSEKVLGVKC